MIREIIRPSENFIHIPIPNEYINKNIEILIFEIEEPNKKENAANELLAEFRKVCKTISRVDKNIDILKLDEDMNSDIF